MRAGGAGGVGGVGRGAKLGGVLGPAYPTLIWVSWNTLYIYEKKYHGVMVVVVCV